MISKEFIDYIADKARIKQRELIEKDLILQNILKGLHDTDYFRNGFVFKGGTCLIKCYLGYYRFSEDLDFTWINQELFKKKSEKQIRKILSGEINNVLAIIKTVADKLNLDFIDDKTNNRYIEFGGSNKFVTFKLWHKSQILERDQFIKIQLNFVELFKYPFNESAANTITKRVNVKEAEFLFEEDSVILKEKIKVTSYDIREILLEKARAILTRAGIKARDFVDLYFISTKFNLKLEDYKEEIKDKILFMLRYEKYMKNIVQKEEHLRNVDLTEVQDLLLVDIPKDFDRFTKQQIIFLNNLLDEIKEIVNA